MLSIPSDRAIGADLLAIFRDLDAIMKDLSLTCFVVGATARDILLTHVFGLPTPRATRDLDVGVAVNSWDQFQEIAIKLVHQAKFIHDVKMVHRFYKDDFPLDVIPFRGVATPEQEIVWPPDLSVAMSVAGYEDAYQASVTVRVAPDLTIRVVSLPGLAILKLFAWADRGASDSRDAADLLTLLRTYGEAGNDDRLFGENIDVMENVEYKTEFAGSRLLGRDARQIASETNRSLLSKLLDGSSQRERLVVAMASSWSTMKDMAPEVEELLNQFRMGLVGN